MADSVVTEIPNVETPNVETPNVKTPNVQTDDPIIVDDNEPDVKPEPKANRINRSFVWNHFDKLGKKEGTKQKAMCKHCGKEYCADSNSNGTSSMRTHISIQCREYELSEYNLKRSKDKKQKTLGFEPVSAGVVKLTAANFSVEACRKALAEMIIVDELPFRFVEGQGFKKFVHVLQPKFHSPGRLVVAKDCIRIYQDEKKSLKKRLKNQRICLTTDTWTSLQNLNYMCLTAHFIDCDWKIHKKILNFCLVPNHKGETLGNMVEQCLVEWGIQNILTITMDNASSNKGVIDHLRKKTKDKDSTILNHDYLHVRCSAHILNLIVREGLKEVDVAVARVRNMVRYVRSSPQRYQKFRSCCERDEIKDKHVPCLDVATRWNSTFFMLERALIFQKAFDRLYEVDRINLVHGLREDEINVDFDLEDEVDGANERVHCVGTPNNDDWYVVEMYAKVLKTFLQVTERFSGSLYVTTNTYFKEVMTVQGAIAKLEESDEIKLKLLGGKMRGKYNKYWGELESMNILFLFAHVLDPRFKFSYMRWIMNKCFDSSTTESKIVRIKDRMTRVYNWYERRSIEQGQSQYMGESSRSNGNNTKRSMDFGEELDTEYAQHMQEESNMVSKSEIERYWLEGIEQPSDKFDLLIWWKGNSLKYPIVSQIARDILAIPVSTVASESAFSTGGRILDPYRTSLSPKTAEALICAQNWLRQPMEISIRETLDEAEKLEEEILEALKEDVSSITLL